MIVCLLLAMWQHFLFPDPGTEAYRRGDFTVAASHFEQAARQQKNFTGFYNLGNARFQVGDYTEAIHAWSLALASARDKAQEARAMYNIGNAYFMAGRYAEASVAFKKALQLAPYSGEARQNLTLSYQYLAKASAGSASEQPDERKTEQRGASGASSGPADQPAPLPAAELESLMQAIARAEEDVQRKIRLAGNASSASAKDW